MALQRRRGLPLTLCLLHMVVGRGAGLDVQPVALPGHVVSVARWQSGGAEVVRYVDAFDGGRVMAPEQVR